MSGPGTELKALLADMGVDDSSNCQCAKRAAQMDRWGAAGCRERKPEIVRWLLASYKDMGRIDRLRLALRAVLGTVSLDPVHALVDEAIRRAELKEPLT